MFRKRSTGWWELVIQLVRVYRRWRSRLLSEPCVSETSLTGIKSHVCDINIKYKSSLVCVKSKERLIFIFILITVIIKHFPVTIVTEVCVWECSQTVIVWVFFVFKEIEVFKGIVSAAGSETHILEHQASNDHVSKWIRRALFHVPAPHQTK